MLLSCAALFPSGLLFETREVENETKTATSGVETEKYVLELESETETGYRPRDRSRDGDLETEITCITVKATHLSFQSWLVSISDTCEVLHVYSNNVFPVVFFVPFFYLQNMIHKGAKL